MKLAQVLFSTNGLAAAAASVEALASAVPLGSAFPLTVVALRPHGSAEELALTETVTSAFGEVSVTYAEFRDEGVDALTEAAAKHKVDLALVLSDDVRFPGDWYSVLEATVTAHPEAALYAPHLRDTESDAVSLSADFETGRGIAIVIRLASAAAGSTEPVHQMPSPHVRIVEASSAPRA